MLLETIRSRPWLSAALFVAAAATGTILGAWFFEFVVGLPPCPLCLQQRVPYYVTIPAALAVAGAIWLRFPAAVVRLGLVALAGLMVWSTVLGAYHAGAEWGSGRGRRPAPSQRRWRALPAICSAACRMPSLSPTAQWRPGASSACRWPAGTC